MQEEIKDIDKKIKQLNSGEVYAGEFMKFLSRSILRHVLFNKRNSDGFTVEEYYGICKIIQEIPDIEAAVKELREIYDKESAIEAEREKKKVLRDKIAEAKQILGIE